MANKLEVNQLDSSCWQIKENTDGPIFVSSFLVAGKTGALLIDSGFGHENLRETVDKLAGGLPLRLANTHADGDHIYGNKYFGPAHMHPAEYDRYHKTLGPGMPTSPLWEGDVIDLGGRSLEVILIPGHTPGSIVLLDAQNRVLFGGDSIQAGLIFMAGPGRNIDSYIESLKKLKAMQNRFDRVYAAHGDAVVASDLLDELLAGAVKVRKGEVPGVPMGPPFEELKARVYKLSGMQLLYRGEEEA